MEDTRGGKLHSGQVVHIITIIIIGFRSISLFVPPFLFLNYINLTVLPVEHLIVKLAVHLQGSRLSLQ